MFGRKTAVMLYRTSVFAYLFGDRSGGNFANDIDSLKLNLRYWTLLQGVLQITVGCIVGFIPPSAVAWFRGIVMAHIEFTPNGVLMIAFGFLVKELRLNPTALKAWFATLQIGTWTNGAAGLAAAFLGILVETHANA